MTAPAGDAPAGGEGELPGGAPERVARLEELCARDPGERGIAPLARHARGGLLAAARSIAAHPRPHVAILTGFYVARADPPAAETDGPVGAAQLAAALARAGVPARLVTDTLCRGAVAAAARAAGVGQLPIDVPAAGAPAVIGALWRSAEPPVSHVVAVERAGPAADGTCRNMRGDDITALTAPLHELFTAERVRVGIGDGGNELGMGSLPRQLVAASVPGGGRIACVVPCDHLLVCGASNWGTFALAAALALCAPRWRPAILSRLTVEDERRILEATVADGPAVDGVLGRQEASVDGIPWPAYAAVLQEMLEVVASA